MSDLELLNDPKNINDTFPQLEDVLRKIQRNRYFLHWMLDKI